MKRQLFVPGLSLLLAGFIPALAAAQATPAPLALKATIALPNVSGRMDHLSIDLQGHRLFASALGHNTVEVLDIAANRRLRSITGFAEPQGILYDRAANRLLVASGEDGTVKSFDGSSYAPLAQVKFSADADNLRYDAHTRSAIVGYGGQKFVGGKAVRGQGDGALAFVTFDGKTSPGISVDAHPESFQIEPDGVRVYVNVPDRHEIEVGDLARHTVVAHWPVTCTDNFPMALDAVHHRLFVGCRLPAKMMVYDTQTGSSVGSLPIPGTTDDLFYDAARQRIYVLGGEGRVDVFAQKDADHYTRIARVPVPAGSRTGLYVPELNELFVSVSKSARNPAEILVFSVQ